MDDHVDMHPSIMDEAVAAATEAMNKMVHPPYQNHDSSSSPLRSTAPTGGYADDSLLG